MKPILYLETEREFSTNGIGVLNDAISAPVRRKINATDELEMKYPVKGIHFSELQERRILLTKRDETSRMQPYRIYKITKPMRGGVTVYARHISYDLAGIPVAPFQAPGAQAAVAGLKSNAVVDCPFSFYTESESAAEFNVDKPMPIWRTLAGVEGSLLDTYGGEYDFDRFGVYLRTRLGSDNGVTVRYGKNMTDLEQTIDCSGVFTGVYPYWQGETLVQLEEIIVKVEGDFSFERLLVLDLSSEWDAEPTAEQLRARTERYIKENSLGIPNVSTRFSFVNLDHTVEHQHLGALERVSMGDTVTAYLERMDIEVAARVVETDFDSIREKYNSVTIGNVRANLADTIAQQNKELQKKPSQTMVKAISKALTERITGARGGIVRLLDTDGDGKPDELYVADNPDPALAVKVWRFNHEGWAGSRNGYNGPFDLGATLEDGLLADFVTAAHLVAGTIQSADNGETFFLDLNNSILRMKAISELQDSVTNVNVRADGISAEVAQQTQTLENMRMDIASIQLESGSVALMVRSLMENGVDKVATAFGLIVRDSSVDIHREGSEMTNSLNEMGMYVIRSKGQSNETVMLQADASGVIATNVTVRNYLIIPNSRLEAYDDGIDSDCTAVF